ncbi:MAG: DUF692 domain-containing protein [Comamonadaceae bacterium]|nr:MAG: DUF692 domain-containing protein [Comamonadaceae bacterium]
MLPQGAGVALKTQHLEAALGPGPAAAFFEVHAENYMVDGGPFPRHLEQVRAHRPLSLHGVALGLGGAAPLDTAHLDRLAGLVRRYQPASFSEHLAWSSHGGAFLGDLLPLPYDDATLARVCAHVQQTQEHLGLRLLLENPSTYLAFDASTLGEAQFLSEVVRRTGCGLLLDVTNAWVGCTNRGADAGAYLAALPLHAVGEIHLAGFADDIDAAGAPLLIDDHGGPVADCVWALYRELVERLGPLPTLIEWDNDVPAWPVLQRQARRAEAVLAHCRRMRQVEVPA